MFLGRFGRVITFVVIVVSFALFGSGAVQAVPVQDLAVGFPGVVKAPEPGVVGDPAVVVGESRPDSVSAGQAARALGVVVEDLSQRTPYSRVFANRDGSWTQSSGTGAADALNEDGSWSPVDLDLQPAVEGDGFVPKHVVNPIVISGGGDGPLVKMLLEGREVRWGWPTRLPVPVVEGNSATFVDVLPGADLVVYATGDGFSHQLVLRERPAAGFDLKMPVSSSDGVKLSEDARGRLLLRSAEGEDLLRAEAPVVWDSKGVVDPEGALKSMGSDVARPDAGEVAATDLGTPAETSVVRGLDARVERVRSGVSRLVLSPDEGFLQDPDTVFPVVVDPSWGFAPAYDTWVSSATPNGGGRLGDDELVVGQLADGSKGRTFIQWNNIPAGATINAATLYLRNHYSRNCVGHGIHITQVTSSWGPGAGISWNQQPALGGWDTKFTPAYGASGCAAGDAWWNMAPVVQSWSSNPGSNFGIRVAAENEGIAASLRRYRSLEHGDLGVQPRLVINFNRTPNMPEDLGIAGSSAGVVADNGPLLFATLSDPEADNVQGKFSVLRAGGAVAWSGSSAWESSGSQVSVEVPENTLANGSYQLKVRAFDGQAESGVAVLPFVVDTGKPRVTVESNSYDLGEWMAAPPPGSPTPGFRFVGSSTDIEKFMVVRDGVVQPDVEVVDSSGVTLYEPAGWLPTQGWHTLEVTPVDRAGNSGDAVSVGFGIGGPGFLAPFAEQSTLGPLRLDIRSRPGATALSLKWSNNRDDKDSVNWQSLSGVRVGSQSGSSWSGGVSDVSSDEGTFSSPGVLSWDMAAQSDGASTLKAPRRVFVQACFSYSGGVRDCAVQPVQLSDGLGDGFPVVDAGPVKIAVTSGAVSLSEDDASLAGVGMGRTWNSTTSAANASGPFGYGWTSQALTPGSTDIKVIDNRVLNSTLVLVSPDGGDQTFVESGLSGQPNEYEFVATDPVAARSTRLVLSLTSPVDATPKRLRLIEDADTTAKPGSTDGDVDGRVMCIGGG